MRKLLELMKIPLITTAIVAVLCGIIYIYTYVPKYDRDKIEAFDEIREDFYVFNDYILTEYDNIVDTDRVEIIDGRSYFHQFYYYDYVEESNFPDEIKSAAKNIMKWFSYDNIYVEVSDNWIAYSVAGYEKYLFSKHGVYVKADFDAITQEHCNWFVLGDNWFFLDIHYL